MNAQRLSTLLDSVNAPLQQFILVYLTNQLLQLLALSHWWSVNSHSIIMSSASCWCSFTTEFLSKAYITLLRLVLQNKQISQASNFCDFRDLSRIIKLNTQIFGTAHHYKCNCRNLERNSKVHQIKMQQIFYIRKSRNSDGAKVVFYSSVVSDSSQLLSVLHPPLLQYLLRN